jgi:secreted trypsin-like serine protease
LQSSVSPKGKNKLLPLFIKGAVVAFCLVGAAIVVTRLSTSGSSPNEANLLIVGGRNAAPKEFPWQVSLQIVASPTTRALHCGGTLIDALHVITAGHCGVGYAASSLEIVAGAYRLKNTAEGTQQRIKVAKLTRHPNFDINRVKNDISVIQLARPVTFNEYVQPLRLPPANAAIEGQVCTLTGWGNSNPTGDTSQPVIIPNELQAVDVTVISNSYCKAIFGAQLVDDTKICAHDVKGGKGPCNGDSGGPFVCTDSAGPFLAGITSFGPETCGSKEGPNVYTRVSSFLDFIEANTQGNNAI